VQRVSPLGGQRRRRVAVLVAATALLLAVLVGISSGAIALAPSDILASVLQRAGLPGLASRVGVPFTGVYDGVLWQIRMPRVVLTALVGGMLAIAGASYQGVFRNPLADPYLLGAAAGAVAAVSAITRVAPRPAPPRASLPLAAFVGAMTGVGLAYALGTLASRHGGGSATLLLAGVAVAAFLTAIQTVVQQAHADSLREVYSWLLGDLGNGHWEQVRLVLPYVVASAVVLLASGRALDVLAVGDEEATTLGVRPRRVRFIVLLAASLGTAAAVSVSGLIGFVGLVVPHVVRRLAGGSYRVVLPVSLLSGATFLVAADLVARTVVAPDELPIGVVTAFVGAPFFAALLRIGGGST
jgi:iron complex transport system permease protein